MEVLVVYDVNTETREGRRRLRRVAKRCEAFGQRVQYSVFECILDDKGYERLQHALKEIIDRTSTACASIGCESRASATSRSLAATWRTTSTSHSSYRGSADPRWWE